MKKIKIYIFFLCIIINFKAYATDAEFEEWKKKFKSIALEMWKQLIIEKYCYNSRICYD